MGRRDGFRLLWGVLACTVMLVPAHAQDLLGTCRFDTGQSQFSGSPVEQARCLLRRVDTHGHVDARLATLPPALEALIGQPIHHLLKRLPPLLDRAGLDTRDLGGSVQQAASALRGQPARYFVIHDTSWPWLGDADFPADDAPSLNDLSKFTGRNGTAHVFVNRLGRTLTTHDFSEPWRATKLEMRAGETNAKGLFLHVELLQPRRRLPSGRPGNDAWAPSPGFTAAQYQQLAWLYVTASARSGHWLIPAFHAAIDEGLPDAHDDPQNFELTRFTEAVRGLTTQLDIDPDEQIAAVCSPSELTDTNCRQP